MPVAEPLSSALDPRVWPWLALALGLITGSFANVCIHRLPAGGSIVRPASRCPACASPIRARDNVPVLSYLLLRGRCRDCGVRISPRYPLIELANGLLWMAAAAQLGPTLRALALMAFVSALLVLSVIDLEHQILPDAITLPGAALALVASLLPEPPSPLESLASAASGYLGFAAVAWVARRYYEQEALGQGDWKLAALLGAFLGWRKLLLTVFVGSAAGSVVGLAMIALGRGTRMTKVPFGTFLGLAGIAVALVGDPVIDWYRQFLDA